MSGYRDDGEAKRPTLRRAKRDGPVVGRTPARTDPLRTKPVQSIGRLAHVHYDPATGRRRR